MVDYKDRYQLASYSPKARLDLASLSLKESYGTLTTREEKLLRSIRRLRAEEIGLIFDEDDDWMKEEYTWVWTSNGYAHTDINGKSISAQKLVHSHMVGRDLDTYERKDHCRHVTPTPLDCRRSNIHTETGALLNRIDCRRTLQSNNTSGCTGVHFHKQKGKWNVIFKLNGTNFSVGLYDDYDAAVYAREKMIDMEQDYINTYSIEWWVQFGPDILRNSWKDIRDEFYNK